MRATSRPAITRASCRSRRSRVARQLRATGVDDAPVDEDVHAVGLQVLEQPLVVRDAQHAELRTIGPHLLYALGHDLQRVDVETGVGLVEHRELGLEDRHLQISLRFFSPPENPSLR